MKNLLTIKDLKYSYDTKIIFNGLTFFIDKNSINAVLGSNNCGKTTLIKILSGSLQFNNLITLNDFAFDLSNIEEYLKYINFCFLPNKITRSNVTVFSELKRCIKKYSSSTRINALTSEILINFELINVKMKKIKELDKVEFIKFIFAVLIIKKPKILFIDNLFEELNYHQYIDIMKFIRNIINKYDVSILYTTNRLDMCLLCDKVIFINNGICEISGRPQELLEYDNVLTREGIYIPTMIDLSLKLKFYNLIDEIIFDPKEMVEKLWK